MKVYVYYNLHKKCWSVRDIKTKRVVCHKHILWLKDAKFVVSQAGRNRVLKEKRKNVHAGVKGDFLRKKPDLELSNKIRYNPYLYGYFFNKFHKPVYEAGFVYMAHGEVFI